MYSIGSHVFLDVPDALDERMLQRKAKLKARKFALRMEEKEDERRKRLIFEEEEVVPPREGDGSWSGAGPSLREESGGGGGGASSIKVRVSISFHVHVHVISHPPPTPPPPLRPGAWLRALYNLLEHVPPVQDLGNACDPPASHRTRCPPSPPPPKSTRLRRLCVATPNPLRGLGGIPARRT